jgi:hypothetical protein
VFREVLQLSPAQGVKRRILSITTEEGQFLKIPHDCEDHGACNNNPILDEYNNPLDQEDYNYEIKSIANKDFAKKCRLKWKTLSRKLLFDNSYQEWWDLAWDRIGRHPREYHPFWRYILFNIMSVITAIHVRGNTHGTSCLNSEVYQQFTMRLVGDNDNPVKDDCSLSNHELDNILQNPKICLLYESLPIHFRKPYAWSGMHSGLTLPKAESLVKYMLGRELTNTMLGLHAQMQTLKDIANISI